MRNKVVGQIDAHQHGAAKEVGHHGLGGDFPPVCLEDTQELGTVVGIGALDQATRAVIDRSEIREPAGRIACYE